MEDHSARKGSAQVHGLFSVLVSGASMIGFAGAQASPVWKEPDLWKPRSQHAMVYDPDRHRTVLYGGEGLEGALDDTWETDGSSWVRMRTALSPASSRFPAMVYDVARRKVVLLAGNLGVGLVQTWEYDGTSWVLRFTGGPMPRFKHAMAYDIQRQRTVCFGGFSSLLGGVDVNDTWEWDGTTWIQCSPQLRPTARTGHTMAYDGARSRVVLFGGRTTNGPLFSDTWEWDGTNWILKLPVVNPALGAGASMSYDSVRQRIVLCGERSGLPDVMDTYEWDGSQWTVMGSVGAPLRRNYQAMCYDEARQRTVLFGGKLVKSPQTQIADTWEWDGTHWTRTRPTSLPGPRSGHGFCSGVAQQNSLLFGGEFGFPLVTVYDDTWIWDGARWLEAIPVHRPPALASMAMATDDARQRVLMFGGKSYGGTWTDRGETWEWNGLDWSLASPALSPPPRSESAAAYDAVRQRTVLFGGTDQNGTFGDTWLWDGVTWTQVQVVGPSSRASHAMAYDAARQRVVLFGGRTSAFGLLGDTWEWDGSTWTQVFPTNSPSPRSGHAMAYDPVRHRVVLTCGNGTSETWEWDGVQWIHQALSDLPAVVASHAMAYDAARGSITSFGGFSQALGFQGTAMTFQYASQVPSNVTVLGSGCPGSSGVPLLNCTLPSFGSDAVFVDVTSARPGSNCIFSFAGAAQVLPVGGGCTFFLKDPIVPVLASVRPSGFATVKLVVPALPALRGASLYAQGFVPDPNGSALGHAFTRGLQLVIGD